MTKVAFVTVDRATGQVLQWGVCGAGELGLQRAHAGQAVVLRTDSGDRPPEWIDPASLPEEEES